MKLTWVGLIVHHACRFRDRPFDARPDGVHVKTTFDAETENPPELQQQGWQAILDNFGRHVEAKR